MILLIPHEYNYLQIGIWSSNDYWHHHNLGAVLGRLPGDHSGVVAGGDVEVGDGAAGDLAEVEEEEDRYQQ